MRSSEPGRVKLREWRWEFRSLRGLLLLLGVILPLTFGLLLGRLGILNLLNEHVYRTKGEIVRGIVLTKTSQEEHHYANQHDTRIVHYHVGYRFSTVAGQTIEGSDDVDWSIWSSINENDPIQIVYMPRDPSTNRVAGHNSVLVDWLFAALGALLSLAGVGLLGSSIFYPPRRTGRPTHLKLVSTRQICVARQPLQRRR